MMLGFPGLRYDPSVHGYALRKTFYNRFLGVLLRLW